MKYYFIHLWHCVESNLWGPFNTVEERSAATASLEGYDAQQDHIILLEIGAEGGSLDVQDY